jgi:hypothetical protein
MDITIDEISENITNVSIDDELIISIDEPYEQVLVYEPDNPSPVAKVDLSEA